jgi:putative FmdB family regulatory protein
LPNYDYLCLDCKKAFTVFLTFQEYGKRKIACPVCHGKRIQRRIGRIRMMRSEESQMGDLPAGDDLSALEEDPKAMGRMLRKMRSQVGEESAPEFDEVVNRLEAGQSPQDIETAMPDLAAGMDAGMGMGSGMGDDAMGDELD